MKVPRDFWKGLSGSHVIFCPRGTPPASELNSSTGRKKIYQDQISSLAVIILIIVYPQFTDSVS